MYLETKLGKLAYNISKRQAEPHTLAILLPGYLDTKDYEHFVRLQEELAKSGFLSASLDPSGTWESGGNIRLYTITNYLKNIDAGVEYFKTQYPTIKSVVLIGHSLGGFVAIVSASRNKSVSAVVAVMTPSSLLREGTEERFKKWQSTGFRKSTRDLPKDSDKTVMFEVPFSTFGLDSKKYNALGAVKILNKPLLLIAGELDGVVPINDIKEIYNASDHEKTKFKIIGGVDHDYRLNKEDIEKVNKEIIGFLEEISL